MDWLIQYTHYFPVAAFIALLLAGVNVPISEDLIIITGALICTDNKTLLFPTLVCIYSAVIISDFICYWLGVGIRRGILKTQFAVWLFSPKVVDKIQYFLDKFGIFTFIVCRFIPFGVRNTLFMSSGLTGLKLKRFILYDIPAAIISVSTLIFLVYHFGDIIKKPFEIVGLILFVMLFLVVALLILRIVRHLIHQRKKINEP